MYKQDKNGRIRNGGKEKIKTLKLKLVHKMYAIRFCTVVTGGL